MTFAEHAPRLGAAGYEPVPCQGKRAIPEQWSEGGCLATWIAQYPGANVGILTRQCPAVDVDTWHPELAADIRTFASRMLGTAPVRIGQAPKALLLYRNPGEPFPKLKLAFAFDGQDHAVEVLANGQQAVALGTHPDTGQPYVWETDPDLSIPRGLLPPLAEFVAVSFMRRLRGVLEDVGAAINERASSPILRRELRLRAARLQRGARCTDAYARATLDGVCDDIQSAPCGAQEETLNAGAWKLGRLVATGVLSHDEARSALIDAGLAMPSYDPRRKWRAQEIERKVDRALDAGRRAHD